MPNFIFPPDPSRSRPFHFAEETQPSDARIGGNLPVGLALALTEHGRYFGTFPLYADPTPLYFSLFINCAFPELMVALNRGFQTDARIVAVTHAPLPRSASTQFNSQLTPHILCLGEPQPDQVQAETGETVFRERHKFGGRPFCIQEPILKDAEALLAQGYGQVLQIDFPGPDDGAISGNWPFGDGMFNLFWKYPFVGERYYWYLQG